MTDYSQAADPAGNNSMLTAPLNINNFDEFEAQLEELFDKADHLMIHLKKPDEAVSLIHVLIISLFISFRSTIKFFSWIQRILMPSTALLSASRALHHLIRITLQNVKIYTYVHLR